MPHTSDVDDKEFIMQLSTRLAAASDVLGELAKRDGRVAEIMRLRLALERVVERPGEAAAIAREALRWITKSS